MRHQTELAQEALEVLVARYSGVAAFQIAEVEVCRGESGKALDWLDRAFDQHDSALAIVVKHDPFLKALQGNPRFVALLRKMNLPVD